MDDNQKAHYSHVCKITGYTPEIDPSIPRIKKTFPKLHSQLKKKTPTWELLARVGDAKPFRAAYFYLLLAPLLLSPLDLINSLYDIDLGWSPALIKGYFASVFIAVGHILYLVYENEIIEKYGREKEYVKCFPANEDTASFKSMVKLHWDNCNLEKLGPRAMITLLYAAAALLLLCILAVNFGKVLRVAI